MPPKNSVPASAGDQIVPGMKPSFSTISTFLNGSWIFGQPCRMNVTPAKTRISTIDSGETRHRGVPSAGTGAAAAGSGGSGQAWPWGVSSKVFQGRPV
jgi:hypothetical protein